MHTQEREVLAAGEHLTELKQSLMQSLTAYVTAKGNADVEAVRTTILDSQQRAAAYFNYAENFVGNSDLLGAHDAPKWVQGFAETCAGILKSMPAIYELLGEAFGRDIKLQHINHLPDSTAFANMQRMVVEYLTVAEARDLQRQFEQARLPVYGFKNPAKDPPVERRIQSIMAFGFGVVFLSVVLLIAVFQPNPSEFQYKVYRIVLALAAGGVGAVIPGLLVVNVSKMVRAGGAMAIFAVVYFWNPAQLF